MQISLPPKPIEDYSPLCRQTEIPLKFFKWLLTCNRTATNLDLEIRANLNPRDLHGIISLYLDSIEAISDRFVRLLMAEDVLQNQKKETLPAAM